MATQDGEAAIPLTFSSRRQHDVRLLELPPRVLDMISANPAARISIKATAPSAAGHSASSLPAHAVLCTGSHTFQLRQVQSSNSMLLVQPLLRATTEAVVGKAALSVVATPKATLELHQISSSAEAYLDAALTSYDGPDEDSRRHAAAPRSADRPKTRVFQHIPVSDEECERAWLAMCAFENDAAAYRPSPRVLAALWDSIQTAATSAGMDLLGAIHVDSLWDLIEDTGYPRAMLDAVLARISKNGVDGVDATELGLEIHIDQAKCVPWVGLQLLQSKYSYQRAIEVSQFLREWADALPEAWRASARLDCIKGHYLQPTPTSIRFHRDSATAHGAHSVTGTGAAAANRKWHDKFRNRPR